MQTTINISLPKKILEDAKKAVAQRGYASVSEFIRNALRNELYPPLTENGFTPEFERQVLDAAKEPNDKSRAWNGKGSFTDFVLKHSSTLNGNHKIHRKLMYEYV